MLNLLKTLRYFIFVVFVICNAIITSVAVWNLGIIQSMASEVTVKHIDSFLIFVGASGLLLIFTILFFEIYGKNVVLVRVWFELLWIGLYCLMELVGAALITAQSSSTCDTTLATGTAPANIGFNQESPCASIQVLQAFTWICATLLLGYFTVLAILVIVKWKDDPTIWDYAVRRFPVMVNNYHPSQPQHAKKPSAPSSLLSRFSGNRVPIIAAPTPRKAAVIREPVLSYRSGLGLEYEIGHYQSLESALSHGMSSEEQGVARPHAATLTGASLQAQNQVQNLSQLAVEQRQEPTTQPTLISSPFYHSSVQTALETRPDQRHVQTQQSQSEQGQEQRPQERIRPLPLVHVDQQQIRRLPPSPPPLGDWPRQNPIVPTAKAIRVKRKPLPQPEPQSKVESQSQTSPFMNWSSQAQAQYEVPSASTSRQPPRPEPLHHSSTRRHPRPLPPLQPSSSPSSYPVDPSELTAALRPLASPSFRLKSGSKPSGPRRKSTFIDEGRPHEFGS